MTWAEFLKSQGATDEDIKVLDTPVARKAFDKQQADAEAAVRAGEDAKAAAKKDRDQLTTWFNDVATPEFKEMERRAIASEAEAAKAKAAWNAAQERGLIDQAQLDALGYKKETNPPANSPLPPGFDPKQFIARDEAKQVFDQVGDNLAALEDLVMEHKLLFPDKSLKVRDLRREAVAAGKTVNEYWEQKYGVPAARQKYEDDRRTAYENKLREEGAAKARSDMASQYGNPEARPLVPSSSPFTKRVESGRDKQPWERQDDPVNDRVARATEKLLKRQAETTH